MPGVLDTTVYLQRQQFVPIDLSMLMGPGESVRVALWVPSQVGSPGPYTSATFIGVRAQDPTDSTLNPRGTIEARASGLLTVEFPPNWPRSKVLLLWSDGDVTLFPLQARIVAVVAPALSNRLRVNWGGYVQTSSETGGVLLINSTLIPLIGTVVAHYGGASGGSVAAYTKTYGIAGASSGKIINATTITPPAGPWSASLVLPAFSTLSGDWTSNLTLFTVDLVGG